MKVSSLAIFSDNLVLMFCSLVILNYGLQLIDNCVLDVITVLDYKQCYLYIRGLHVLHIYNSLCRWYEMECSS